MSTIPVLQLTRTNLPALRRHFLALPPEDLRLRFGRVLNETTVLAYVDSISFERDTVFGVFDDALELLGAAHLGLIEDAAEIGVSVIPEHRGKGIGSALFERCAQHARNHGISNLFMHCLSENASMMRIAKRSGMEIITGYGEAEAYLKLPPPDQRTMTDEFFGERIALFDFALKSQFATARSIVDAMVDATKRGKDGGD